MTCWAEQGPSPAGVRFLCVAECCEQSVLVVDLNAFADVAVGRVGRWPRLDMVSPYGFCDAARFG